MKAEELEELEELALYIAISLINPVAGVTEIMQIRPS